MLTFDWTAIFTGIILLGVGGLLHLGRTAVTSLFTLHTDVKALIVTVRDNLDHLNAIRRELLVKATVGALTGPETPEP